jgi:23S rRNA (pseudouridine1915-N3)-methyltransferase
LINAACSNNYERKKSIQLIFTLPELMVIYLLAVGNKMPDWVNKGYIEYAKRLSGNCRLELIEIAPLKRGKNTDLSRIKKLEGEKLLYAIPKGAKVVALEVNGKSWSTEQLSLHGQMVTRWPEYCSDGGWARRSE